MRQRTRSLQSLKARDLNVIVYASRHVALVECRRDANTSFHGGLTQGCSNWSLIILSLNVYRVLYIASKGGLLSKHTRQQQSA